MFFFLLITDGIVGPGTITSPWTPVSAGHPSSLGPADSNGSMVDSKNLDVGDMSDVSIESHALSLNRKQYHKNCSINQNYNVLKIA